MLFDDWNDWNGNPELGQQRAFREFLDQHPGWRIDPFMLFDDHGQGFVLRLA
jgi:O-methyltransferase